MSFSLAIINMGTEDALIGDPENPGIGLSRDDFVYDTCHMHYHFKRIGRSIHFPQVANLRYRHCYSVLPLMEMELR